MISIKLHSVYLNLLSNLKFLKKLILKNTKSEQIIRYLNLCRYLPLILKRKKTFRTLNKNMIDSDDLNDVASDIIMCNYEDCLTINITRE